MTKHKVKPSSAKQPKVEHQPESDSAEQIRVLESLDSLRKDIEASPKAAFIKWISSIIKFISKKL
jgi:hypothetical protein